MYTGNHDILNIPYLCGKKTGPVGSGKGAEIKCRSTTTISCMVMIERNISKTCPDHEDRGHSRSL